MKKQFLPLLLLGVSTLVHADSPSKSDFNRPDGLLQSIDNASVTRAGSDLLVSRKDPQAPIELTFSLCQGLGLQYQNKQWWVLPIDKAGAHIDANRALWILPFDARSHEHSWRLALRAGELTAEATDSVLKVKVEAQSLTLSQAEARPHSDPFGNRFSLQIDSGQELEDALAVFYWGTMLPSVVEKTMAAQFPYNCGYVLSTLNVKAYAGSYPAVDHEFQIKGRLAVGSDADLDIVKRMIELQFRLMRDDPEHLSRAPTSVQPDGRREYHIRRNSLDDRQNAAMFPLTGDIEVIEESCRYYAVTKNTVWLQQNIGQLENAADWILSNIDQYGRAWSDVYYEDQVIEDGRVTEAQAFAAHAFTLLAQMEDLLERKDQANRFAATSKKMAAALVAPLPVGYWDPKKQRFVDWVDRDGKTHDHIHLLANVLPVSFKYATPDQASAVRHLVEAYASEFERFPSFVAADIAAYTKSEIGVGGPYDLCAAGRYWYWDAAFRESQGQNGVWLDQLRAVAAEAAKNNYFMSERYDMDHVYFIDGKDAHGAEKYYEYPNVFAAVLIDKYLGLGHPADADVSIAPHVKGYGTVEFEIPAYALSYIYNADGFVLKNLSDRPRHFKIDLSATGSSTMRYRRKNTSGGAVGSRWTVTLAAHEEVHWVPERVQ